MIKYILFLSILSLFAHGETLTQKQLAKIKLKEYFLKIPQKFLQCSKHLLGMGDYQLLKSEAPTFFNVLKININRNIPGKSHSLAFTNDYYSFTDVLEVEFGLCLGHSTVQRKFNILSFFDVNNQYSQLIPNKKTNPEEWFLFYQNKIKNLLLHNQPEIFPEFNDVYELSSEPRLQLEIKKLVADLWAEKNISLGGLKILSSVTKKRRKRKLSNYITN